MVRMAIALALCIAVAAIVIARAPDPRTALACTGGGSGLEDAARRARIIVLGDAVDVGDAVNRAPAVAPTSTPTGTPTLHAGTPAATPPSPPMATGQPFPRYATPDGFTLAGFGVTLRVINAYTSALPRPQSLLQVDDELRASIEREIRQLETGRGLTDCELGRFSFKFEQDIRYLVFATDDEPGFGLLTIFRLRVVGNEVFVSDPLATTYDPTGLYVSAAIYHRFFEGVAAEVGGENDIARITADRVPLSAVLRAVAYLRHDASIAPPDTGSAGLASGR